MFCHEQHSMQCGQRRVQCFVINSMACSVVRNMWSIFMNSMACNVVRDVWNVLSRTAWHAMWSEACVVFVMNSMACSQRRVEYLSWTASHVMWSATFGMFYHEQHGMQRGQRRVQCFVMNSMACNVVRNIWNVFMNSLACNMARDVWSVLS